MSDSKSNRKLNMCIDDLSVMELAVLIGGFCGEQTKYYRYGKNLKLAWRVLLKTVNVRTVYDRIGFRDPRKACPPEAVAAVKKLMKPGRMSDDRIESFLTNYVDHGFWKDELTQQTKAQEEKHFQGFKQACVSYVNRNMKHTGVTLRMPTKTASKED